MWTIWQNISRPIMCGSSQLKAFLTRIMWRSLETTAFWSCCVTNKKNVTSWMFHTTETSWLCFFYIFYILEWNSFTSQILQWSWQSSSLHIGHQALHRKSCFVSSTHSFTKQHHLIWVSLQNSVWILVRLSMHQALQSNEGLASLPRCFIYLLIWNLMYWWSFGRNTGSIRVLMGHSTPLVIHSVKLEVLKEYRFVDVGQYYKLPDRK